MAVALQVAKSARVSRLESELQRVLSTLISRDVRDPRVGAVTLTHVQLTPDLREARVAFVPFLSAQPVDGVADGLNHAAGFLRGEAGRRLGLRHAPKLTFHFDESIERASRMSQLIDRAVKSDRATHPETNRDDESS
jgi:ribosome-binding factor A